MEERLILMDKNKANWVSASDVGRAAFCGHFLELKYAGHKVSKYSEQLMKQGDVAHDNLNKLAEDKRCFIASYLYGVENIQTAQLRHYRDSTLIKTKLGKLAVNIYYRLSPSLVALAQHSPIIHSILKKAVDYYSLKIRRKTNG